MLARTPMTRENIPVLFDTDIGSDIDDALALAYLLRQPRCELVGITTVTGDVQRRAAIAEVLCRNAGRQDIPIHCGRRLPLAYGPGQPEVPQYAAIADEPHRLDRPENTAVAFLRDTIRRRPGEIVLLTVGPLANVATLFALDPKIPFLLRGIVSMAGVFFAPGRREWNVLADPEAAAIVYATNRPSHRTYGLDVTERCRLKSEEARARFQGPLLEAVLRMAEHWFTQTDAITFHDPLAAATIFRPDLCSYRDGRVRVTLADDADRSGTTVLTSEGGVDRIAESVDPDAFFHEFFDVAATS